MNTYLCYYRGEALEVKAHTSRDAQSDAAEQFRRKFKRRTIKDYEVSPMLAGQADTTYVHTAVD
jgi:hypothetical protein